MGHRITQNVMNINSK